MLNLTQQQLSFLIILQMQDDWHCDAFLEKAFNHYENNPELLSAVEFKAMIDELKKLTTDKIAEFQMALNILGDL